MSTPIPSPAALASRARKLKEAREATEEKRRLREECEHYLAMGLIQEHLVNKAQETGKEVFSNGEIIHHFNQQWAASKDLVSNFFRNSGGIAESLVGEMPQPHLITVVTVLIPETSQAGNLKFLFRAQALNTATGAAFTSEASTREKAELKAINQAVNSDNSYHPVTIRHSIESMATDETCSCGLCLNISKDICGRLFIRSTGNQHRGAYLAHYLMVCAQLDNSANSGVILEQNPLLPEQPRFFREEVDIFTDASRAHHAGIGAIAGVSADGRHFAKAVAWNERRKGSIHCDEATAVLTAIEKWWGLGATLAIHTDSLRTVRAIADFQAGRELEMGQQFAIVIEKIVRLIDAYASFGGKVHVGWVRGHSGVYLNEIADRLARTVQRGKRFDSRGHGTQVIVENIISEMLSQASYSADSRTPINVFDPSSELALVA